LPYFRKNSLPNSAPSQYEIALPTTEPRVPAMATPWRLSLPSEASIPPNGISIPPNGMMTSLGIGMFAESSIIIRKTPG